MIIIARSIAVLLVLAATSGIIFGMYKLKSTPPVQPPGDTRPLVRVVVPKVETVALDVDTTGTVQAFARMTLAAEVTGRLESVSAELQPGAIAATGSELWRTETVDLDAAVARVQAEVASAELALAQEKALASEAVYDLGFLDTAEPSALARHEPQIANAQARVASSTAALQQAQRDRERSTMLAPRDVVIEARLAESGQWINRGQGIFQVRAADAVEVEVPVTLAELTRLGLQPTPGELTGPATQATVVTADGRSATGPVVRSRGNLDPMTRLAMVIIRLPGTANMVPGDHVAVHFAGSHQATGITIPRYLVRRDGTVLLVDSESRLIEHPTQILLQRRAEVVIAPDLPPNTWIVLNRLEAWSAGSVVRIAENDPPAAADSAPDAATDAETIAAPGSAADPAGEKPGHNAQTPTVHQP